MAEIARKTKRDPSDLTDEEWAQLEPLMPKPARRGRKPSVDLREMRTRPVRLTITTIFGGAIASYESAVILSVTPNHGGVTDARRNQQQRSHLAGGRTLCGDPSR
jgi:hypothetical protein